MFKRPAFNSLLVVFTLVLFLSFKTPAALNDLGLPNDANPAIVASFDPSSSSLSLDPGASGVSAPPPGDSSGTSVGSLALGSSAPPGSKTTLGLTLSFFSST